MACACTLWRRSKRRRLRAKWLLLHRGLLGAFLWNSSMMDIGRLTVAPHNVVVDVQADNAPAVSSPAAPLASSPLASSSSSYVSPLLMGAATGLLAENYRDRGLGATIPSPLLDEHQHSTTSLMVAHAWAHIDQDRARSEMLSIFRGQWENGMVPTVRYAPGYVGDFLGGSIIPGPGGWGNASARSAEGANTSALAATPLHAEVTLKIFDLSPRDAEARLWLQGLFPALFRYHDYLHRSREDPETGLVYVYHPWETEVAPDSVLWPLLLEDTSERAANESWSPPPIPANVSSVVGFPGEETFEAALFLAACAARLDHVDRDVQRECPFLLQDVQFNAALVRSDKALLELAGILEATRSGWQSKVYTPEQFERLTDWAARAESGAAMKHFWSPSEAAFLSRYTSAVTSEVSLVRPSTSSSFSALNAPGLAPYRASSAVNLLLSPGELSFRCENYPVPEVECGFADSGGGRGIGVSGDSRRGSGGGTDGGGSSGGGGVGGGGVGGGGVGGGGERDGMLPAASESAAEARVDAAVGQAVAKRITTAGEGAVAVDTDGSIGVGGGGGDGDAGGIFSAAVKSAAAARFGAVGEEVIGGEEVIEEKVGAEEEGAAAAIATTATAGAEEEGEAAAVPTTATGRETGRRSRGSRSKTLPHVVGAGAGSAAGQEDLKPNEGESDEAGREGRALRGGEGEGGAVEGGAVGGEGYQQSRHPCLAAGACVTDGKSSVPSSGQRTGEESDGVRVWVLHNLLAARGLGQQSLLGLSAWLANSTLSLIVPDESMAEPRIFAEGELVDEPRPFAGGEGSLDNDNVRWFGAEDERFGVFFSLPDGVAVNDSLFRFHRVFEAKSGLPLPDAEGNSSSLAAAASVLLLLGDGPDGGNTFPPITHATLFVLMAIELGFSFIMGVSCLVFSVNLVRKLREEDYPPRGGSGGINAGSANAQPSRRRVGALGVGRGLRVGVVSGKNDEELNRRSGSPADLGYGRGIGSLLRRNAGSRVDLYDDSDDDYAEAVPMTAGGGGRLDAVWTSGGSQDSDDNNGGGGGRDSNGDREGLRDGHYYHALPADNAAGAGGGNPPSRDNDFRKGNATASNPATVPFRWAEGGEMLQEIPPRIGSGAGRGGAGEDDFSPVAGGAQSTDRLSGADGTGGGGGSDDGVDAGILDVLKPFYSSLKFW